MKLYDFIHAPNPRIVRIFIAEKGIEVEQVQVNLRTGEQFSAEFKLINPRCTVPVLQLDSGIHITDSTAICDYLDTAYPEPSLLGTDPEQKAVILSWHLWNQAEGIGGAGELFRNASPIMKDRRRPGLEDFGQNEYLARRGRRRAELYAEKLDQHLRESAYLAGAELSLADISGMVVIDFAKRAGYEYPASLTYLAKWHDKISARPSTSA